MKEAFHSMLLEQFGASDIYEIEVIQSLWSGYGQLTRLKIIGGKIEFVIVKNISLPAQANHPRGWNTNRSHLRKIKSYEVEVEWYKKWAQRCNVECRVPICYHSVSSNNEHRIILEDLDASGFPIRKSSLNKETACLGLRWLANFHATFMNEPPENLWKEGTYWHLSTRPDELAAMENEDLRSMASSLDRVLANCQFQTLVHGDAKLANFCFSEDMTQIVAVDFQYVGGGCGMKDVIYFLGSCLNEIECGQYEDELLDYYFKELKIALNQQQKTIDFDSIEKEWRRMYAIAWADFTRFLLGWMPTHRKINSYSLKMIDCASILLE